MNRITYGKSAIVDEAEKILSNYNIELDSSTHDLHLLKRFFDDERYPRDSTKFLLENINKIVNDNTMGGQRNLVVHNEKQFSYLMSYFSGDKLSVVICDGFCPSGVIKNAEKVTSQIEIRNIFKKSTISINAEVALKLINSFNDIKKDVNEVYSIDFLFREVEKIDINIEHCGSASVHIRNSETPRANLYFQASGSDGASVSIKDDEYSSITTYIHCKADFHVFGNKFVLFEIKGKGFYQFQDIEGIHKIKIDGNNNEREGCHLELTNCVESFISVLGNNIFSFDILNNSKKIIFVIHEAIGRLNIENSDIQSLATRSERGELIPIGDITTKGEVKISNLQLLYSKFTSSIDLSNAAFSRPPEFFYSKMPGVLRFRHSSFDNCDLKFNREALGLLKNYFEKIDNEEQSMFFTKLTYKAREGTEAFQKIKLLSKIYGALTDYGTSISRAILSWLLIGSVFFSLHTLFFHFWATGYIELTDSKTPMWVARHFSPLFITLTDMLGVFGVLFSLDKFLDRSLTSLSLTFLHRSISSFFIYFCIMWLKKMFRQR